MPKKSAKKAKKQDKKSDKPQGTKKREARRLTGPLSITEPEEGADVTIPADGTIRMSGTADLDGENPEDDVVYVAIADAPYNADNFPKDDAVSVVDGFWSKADVPLSKCSKDGLEQYACAWAKFPSMDDPVVVANPFNAFCTPGQVNAIQCMWFAFAADSDPLGPYDESVSSSRPLTIPVPEDARGGTVTITAEGQWRKKLSGVLYGPDGNATDLGHLRPNNNGSDPWYDEYPGADRIQDVENRKQRLIGMWDTSGTETPFSVGSSFTDQPVPATATRLFLAFHDGFEWSNNSRHVTVYVSWGRQPGIYVAGKRQPVLRSKKKKK